MEGTFSKEAKRNYAHVNNAAAILRSYNGQEPFAHFIKAWFSGHKKFGSRDRKIVAHLCYCYFRLGHSFSELPVEEKVLKAMQVCDPVLAKEWECMIEHPELPVVPENIFPWQQEVSATIDFAAFERSHLVQPDLFLRARRGFERVVEHKLTASGIGFKAEGKNSFRISNSSRLEHVLALNREAVIQDLSSQKIGNLLKTAATYFTDNICVWDCCAASGGKSILAKDVLENITLSVSDVRPSIIHNLNRRFKEALIKNYDVFIADATTANPGKQFDLIIADVPCTGSGTWARTPEQLLYFNDHKIMAYAALQTGILSNIIHYLKPGGLLLYITCSVFHKENEAQLCLLQSNNLKLIDERIIAGYNVKADTMFGALLQK
ncbi:MAG: methyltransferase domain-containing protein [Niabella sp.]